MNYLMTSLRGREKDRAQAFLAIGLVAVAIQEDIRPYLSKIMDVIRMSLPIPKDIAAKKRSPTGNPEVNIKYKTELIFHVINVHF